MVGSAPHNTKRFSAIGRRLPRSRFGAFLLALAIYIILLIGIMVWLAIHGEETIQRRLALSPSITLPVAVTKTPETVTEPVVAPTATDAATGEPAVAPAPLATDGEQDAPLPVVAPEPQRPASDKPARVTPAIPAPAATPAEIPVKAPAETPAPVMPDTVTAPPEIQTPQAAPSAPVPAPAWQANTRMFNINDKRARIGLIITNLGMASTATRAAIEQMPADVTLAFQTVAPSITDWIAKARTSGHETLLAVPMEPTNYPQNDPGPQTLLTSLPATDNIQRLTWALARSNQVIGIIPSQGEQFVTSEKAMAPVMDQLRKRELVFVDGTLNPQSSAFSLASLGRIPVAQATVLIDAAAARTAIDQALSDLESAALKNGQAIGIALPYPVTFERLSAWIKTLPAKNIVLAPVSALLTHTTPATLPANETGAPAEDMPSAAAATPSPQLVPAKRVTPPLARITPER